MTKNEKRAAIEGVIKELTAVNADIQKEVESLSSDSTTWKQRHDLCYTIIINIGHIITLQKTLNS